MKSGVRVSLVVGLVIVLSVAAYPAQRPFEVAAKKPGEAVAATFWYGQSTHGNDATLYGRIYASVDGDDIKKLEWKGEKTGRPIELMNKTVFTSVTLDRTAAWNVLRELAPDGKYQLTAVHSTGRPFRASFEIDHTLVPPIPEITSLNQDDTIPAGDTTISWNAPPVGSNITGIYFRIWSNDEGPYRQWEMDLDASATSTVIPAEFLVPGKYSTRVYFDRLSGGVSYTAYRTLDFTVAP